MSSGESLIVVLLVVIAVMLYQIAKQLSYLTGRRLKWSFPKWGYTPSSFPKKVKEKEKEKLSN